MSAAEHLRTADCSAKSTLSPSCIRRDRRRICGENSRKMHDKVKIFVGNIAHCVGAPSLDEYLQFLEPGYVVVDGRKIVAVGGIESLEGTREQLGLTDDKVVVTNLRKSQLLVPGLIDTHIHAPQYPNCGLGYDEKLLEWLNKYTYPLEKKYRDLEFSKRVFDAVVKKTLENGTTTATYFGSLYTNATMVLVDSVIKHGQRALVGKLNMTTLAPIDYIETPEESIKNTKDFVEQVLSKKNDLVKPIITPRFALSVDIEMMRKLADIARDNKLHIQSHISENLEEIQMVRKIFDSSYADTYDQGRLLTTHTILAHGVHLTEEEMVKLSEKGTSIAHCPESNVCLKSGACDVRQLWKYKVRVGLGTDVSGGASPSIVAAMKSAIDNSIQLYFRDKTRTPLTYKEAFYLGTLGGAEALRLEDKIGNFQVDKDFDALIVDMDVDSCPTDYLHECNVQELLQKFVFSGDDRNIVSVFVAGHQVKSL